MFKLVVLSTLLVACWATPTYVHGGYGLSAAVSSNSRVDIHNPIVASNPSASLSVPSAPVVSQPTAVADPTYNYAQAAATRPAVALPTATSHQHRVDVIRPGHQLVHSIQTVPTIVQPAYYSAPATNYANYGGYTSNAGYVGNNGYSGAQGYGYSANLGYENNGGYSGNVGGYSGYNSGY